MDKFSHIPLSMVSTPEKIYVGFLVQGKNNKDGVDFAQFIPQHPLWIHALNDILKL